MNAPAPRPPEEDLPDLRFIVQLAAKGVRARLFINGMTAASIEGPFASVLAKNIGPYLSRGKNVFRLTAELLPPPPEDDGSERLLELAIHAPGPNAPLSNVTTLLRYALTENEANPGDGPHEVVTHALALGSDAKEKHCWLQGSELRPEDISAVTQQGLDGCKRALESKDAGALATWVELHAEDLAVHAEVSVEEATFELVGAAAAAIAAGARVTLRGATELEKVALFGNKLVQLRDKAGGPPIVIGEGRSALGLYPSFSVIGGEVRLVRLS